MARKEENKCSIVYRFVITDVTQGCYYCIRAAETIYDFPFLLLAYKTWFNKMNLFPHIIFFFQFNDSIKF